MFHLLDATLKELLHDPALAAWLPQVPAADVSFATPDGRGINGETINLYLYEVRENRELRNPVPRTDLAGGLATRRRPPLRVDCLYLVTTWAKAASAALQVQAEHRLLGQALAALSRHPVIGEPYLGRGGLAGQLVDPPTMLAQLDGGKSSGEFWTALGIAPRPFFHLLITIIIDPQRAVDDALVTSIHSRVLPTSHPDAADQMQVIAGTLRDRAGRVVRDAWVQLDPPGEIVNTDDQGRFVFTRARRGPGNVLRARAAGQAQQAESPPFEVPSTDGRYDIAFP